MIMFRMKNVWAFLSLFGILVLDAGVEGAYRQKQDDKCDPYCENVPDYPLEKVRAAVRADGNKYQDFFRVDTQYRYPNVSGKQNLPLCNTREQVIYPKYAKNAAGQYVWIINDGKQYRQGIRVEVCNPPGSECALAEHFPHGYKASCIQQWVFRIAAGMTKDGKLTDTEFRVPACCNCELTGLTPRA